MRAAFAVQFSAECCSEDAEVETTDDDNIWEDLDDSYSAQVEAALDSVPHLQRLSCFAHSLQLVVDDGLWYGIVEFNVPLDTV